MSAQRTLSKVKQTSLKPADLWVRALASRCECAGRTCGRVSDTSRTTRVEHCDDRGFTCPSFAPDYLRRCGCRRGACSCDVSGTSRVRAQTRNKGIFVLVHPAWFGGWCWKKVAPLLRARGYDVYTPTLTGLGDRAHLARPEIGLNIHIEDVANLLKYEDLSGVVLVGKSSAGGWSSRGLPIECGS